MSLFTDLDATVEPLPEPVPARPELFQVMAAYMVATFDDFVGFSSVEAREDRIPVRV